MVIFAVMKVILNYSPSLCAVFVGGRWVHTPIGKDYHMFRPERGCFEVALGYASILFSLNPYKCMETKVDSRSAEFEATVGLHPEMCLSGFRV